MDRPARVYLQFFLIFSVFVSLLCGCVSSSSSIDNDEPVNKDLSSSPFRTAEVMESPDARVRFCADLFDRLWETYAERVEYVDTYKKFLGANDYSLEEEEKNNQEEGEGSSCPEKPKHMVMDHVAFRTLATPMYGISSISRLLDALGYRVGGFYEFPTKKLRALHYEHFLPSMPKIFISELCVWELEPDTRDVVMKIMDTHRRPLSEKTLGALHSLKATTNNEQEDWTMLLEEVLEYLETSPWDTPSIDTIQRLHESSHYAAWVIVHGYRVNHFAALVGETSVDSNNNDVAIIDKVVHSMIERGVPMKAQVEGVPGFKLRQSATQAVSMDVPALDENQNRTTIPWNYAYFEFVERGYIWVPDEMDEEKPSKQRFEGFLAEHASNLFEMTAVVS